MLKQTFGPGFGAGFQGRGGTSSAPILKLSFTISALVQMLVYSFVVLYSVLIGGIDLVIPAKTAFLTIVFVLLMKPLDDFTVAWKIRKLEPRGAEDALVYLLISLVASITSISVDLFFLTNPLSSIDLRGEGLGVKTFVILGVVILLLFIREQFKPLFGIGARKFGNWRQRGRI